MVECCSLKTQFRNFFLFINLSDRIKLTQYLELAKQDLDVNRAGDGQCLGGGPWGSSLRPAKPHGVMFPASLFPFVNELKWGENVDAGQLQVSVTETPCATLPWGFKAGFHGNARVSWSCILQGANVKASVLCARFRVSSWSSHRLLKRV